MNNRFSPANRTGSTHAPSSRRKFLHAGLAGGVALGALPLWQSDTAPHRAPAGEGHEELLRILRRYGGELGGRNIV